MKNLLNLYAIICLLALALKFGIQAVTSLNKHKAQVHDHEQEHFYGHLIKLIILILLAAWLIFRN
jgi:cell division protein FtsW (lipid II flippase)